MMHYTYCHGGWCYKLGLVLLWANLKWRMGKAFPGEKWGIIEKTTFANIMEAGKSRVYEEIGMQCDLNEDKIVKDEVGTEHNGPFP